MFDDQDSIGIAALEALSDAIIIVDVDQRIRFINTAACRLLKIDRDSAFGAPVKNLPGGHELMNAHQTKAHHGLFNIETERLRLIQYRSLPILNSDHQPIGIVLKLGDAADERTTSELLQTMFNEMLTPLSFIIGYAELLETQGTLTEEQRKMLQIIKEKAKSLTQLRQELYEAAKKRL